MDDPRNEAVRNAGGDYASVMALIYVGDEIANLREVLESATVAETPTHLGGRVVRWWRVRATTYRG